MFFLDVKVWNGQGAPMKPVERVDATGLMEAALQMRNAYRAAPNHYDVPTMVAFGRVIARLEEMFDFTGGATDGHA